MTSNQHIKLAKSSILRRNPSQLFSLIDGEVVMLNVDKGEYYGLDEVGSNIWAYLENPCSFATLLSQLQQYYDVSEEQCEIDTIPFITELLEEGILILDNE